MLRSARTLWLRRGRLRALAIAAASILVPVPSAPAAAAPGDLDPAFGGGGKVTASFGQISVANAVVERPGGGIVAVGRVGDPLTGDFGAAAFTGDGAVDPGFGLVRTPFSAFEDVARTVAIQPDGKVVVGGLARSEPFGDFALARYDPDGTLDASFGSGGKVTTDLSNGLGDGIRGMALLPDGKILCVGAAGPSVGLVRYMPDGSLDAGFGAAGKQVVRIGNAGHVFALAMLAGGRFLVAGNATGPLSQGDFMLARFNADGTLDQSFGSRGFVTTDFSGLNDLAFALAVQPDGRIVLAGNAGSLDPLAFTGDAQLALARYTPNGALDASFGQGGRVRINPTSSADGLRGVVLQNDGRIVAGGFIGESHGLQSFADPVRGDFGLVRLKADGSPDRGFGAGGLVRTDFAGAGDGGRAAITHGGDSILVAGGATRGQLAFALARYRGG